MHRVRPILGTGIGAKGAEEVPRVRDRNPGRVGVHQNAQVGTVALNALLLVNVERSEGRRHLSHKEPVCFFEWGKPRARLECRPLPRVSKSRQ
jgi:hypothetical protein